VDGDGGSGGEGGEQHPSICGICLFLDKTAARLLARVALLNVLTLFLGGGAGCGDTIGAKLILLLLRRAFIVLIVQYLDVLAGI
jgi:hypothetical protein